MDGRRALLADIQDEFIRKLLECVPDRISMDEYTSNKERFMKRTLISALAAAAAIPMAAQADTLNRGTYGGWVGGYFMPSADIETLREGVGGGTFTTFEDSGDGFGLQGEFPIADALALRGEWFQTEYDGGLELDHLRLGGGLRNASGSGLFLEYTQIDNDGNEVDGPSIHARLGGGWPNGLGLYGQAGYHFLGGDDDDGGDVDGPEFTGGVEFVTAAGLGLFGEYRVMRLDGEQNDYEINTDEVRAGVRLHF